MSIRDEWGHDPSVQMMRRVFAGMETAQEELFRRLALSLFDNRLRHSRDQARSVFEQAWTLGARRGVIVKEEDIVSLYLYCLGRVLDLSGIAISGEVLPADEKIAALARDFFP